MSLQRELFENDHPQPNQPSHPPDERRPFLDELLASPDDDLPRLIYADWLDERGDPRGEFIRVQCQLAQTDETDPNFYEWTARSWALEHDFGRQWAAELQQDVRKTEFHRGFIDTITIRAKVFERDAAKLFRATPIHWIRFNFLKGRGAALAAMPELSKVHSLNLGGLKIPREDLIAILSSPNLTSLRGLNLSGYELGIESRLTADIANALRSSSDSIEHLEMFGDNFSNRFMPAFADGSKFDNLKYLGFGGHNSNSYIDAAKLHVPRLEELTLCGDIAVDDAESLAMLPVAQLKKIDLSRVGFPARGFEAWAARGAFDQVEHLHLNASQLGQRATKAIFQKGHLNHVESLNVSNVVLDGRNAPHVVKAIAELETSNLRRLEIQLIGAEIGLLSNCEHLSNLRHLDIRTHLDTQAAKALSKSLLRESLRVLTISLPSVDAVKVLCREPFPNLVKLHLNWLYATGKDEESVIHLIESGAFPNLRMLDLSSLGLTNKTLNAIAGSPHLQELRILAFDFNEKASVEATRRVLNSDNLPHLARISVVGSLDTPISLMKKFGSRIQV